MSDEDFGTFAAQSEPVAVEAPPRSDGLAWLTEALDAEVPTPTVTVPVEARPGWAVTYRTNLSWHELQNWRKTAARGSKTVDVALLSRLILAGSCVGFVKDGQDAVDDKGAPVTFGTVMRETGAATVADAVRTWLVTDGAISGTSDLVYERSGYRMPEVPDEDPTED